MESNLDTARSEKLAQFLWLGGIGLFFGLQAILWTVAISITSADTSHAVLAGYDEQALKWDETKALMQSSKSLGWETQISVSAVDDADVLGNRTLKVWIADRNDQPIEAATCTLRAFHCGRAAEPQALNMDEVEPGKYEGTLRVRHAGTWQIEGTVSLHGQVFLIDERIRLKLEGSR